MKPLLATSRHALVVLFGFAILYTALFSSVLFTGKVLGPGDGVMAFLPGYYAPRTLWDPYLFCGYPSIGDPQRMAWYPPAMALSRIPGSWNIYVVLAYVLASSFTYGYVLTLTRSRLAGVVAGIVFGMSGFLISHLSHTNMIHSAAWMPAMLWCAEKLRERFSWSWLAAGALAMAHCALAGHPQIFLYASALLVAYALVLGWRSQAGTWRYYRGMLLIVLLGGGMAAIQLLPSRQLAHRTLRSHMEIDRFLSFSLPAWQWPQLFFPYVFGGTVRQPYFGEGNIPETTGYIGLLPLLLAAIGFRFAPGRRLAWFWLSAAAIALLLALGRDGGLGWAMYHVPLFNKFRCQARHFAEFSLAVAVLSGYGLAALLRLPLPSRLAAHGRAALWLTGLTASAWVFFGLLIKVPATGLADHVRALGVPGISTLPWRTPVAWLPLLALALGLVASRWFVWRPGKLLALVLLGALVFDMNVCAWFSDWARPGPTHRDLEVPQGLVRYRDRLHASGERLTSLRSPPYDPVDAAPPNLSALWQIPTTAGYNPLVLTRISLLLGMHENGYVSHHMMHDEDRALDILAARYLLVPKRVLAGEVAGPEPGVERWLAKSQRFKRVDELAETVVFENRRAMPRAWLVSRLKQLPPDEALLSIRESRLPDGSPFDPRQVAIVEEPQRLEVHHPDCDARAEPRELSATVVEIRTESKTPACCVLSNVRYPGWQATVDGRPAPSFTADFVLQGVLVPAGRHTVRFEFRPARFYWGAGISVVSLLVCLGLAAWPWTGRQRTARTHAPSTIRSDQPRGPHYLRRPLRKPVDLPAAE